MYPVFLPHPPGSSLTYPVFLPCSIDGRSGPIKRAPHWSDEGTLGSRAYFDMTSEPPGLVLQAVEASDHAEYRCRVDFRSSPTRNVRIQLEVIGKETEGQTS